MPLRAEIVPATIKYPGVKVESCELAAGHERSVDLWLADTSACSVLRGRIGFRGARVLLLRVFDPVVAGGGGHRVPLEYR